MRMDEHIKDLIEKYTSEASTLSGNEALEKYQMAYAQAKELGNGFTIRACAANLGAIYIKLGRKETAKQGVEHLLTAVPPEGQTDGVSNGDLYFNIALGYEVLGKNREAHKYFEDAWKEYENERDNPGMEIETLTRLIRISQVRLKYEEAISWYEKLEKKYEQSNRSKDQLMLMIHRILLQQQVRQGSVSDDVDDCCKMLDSIRGHGALSVAILVQVSVLLTKFQRQKEAKQYLEEANSMLEVEDSQSLEKAVVMQNLGTVYNYMKQWDASLQYHKQAAAIFEHYATLPPEAKAPMQAQAALKCQGHCLANYGFAKLGGGDVDEARVIFDRTRELAIKSGDLETKWQMEEALGAVHFRLACLDLNLPSNFTADTKTYLSASRREHVGKSLEWYTQALETATKHHADRAVRDRILEKYSLLQTFRKNIASAPEGASKVQLTPVPLAPQPPRQVAPTAVGKEEEEKDDEDEDDSDEEDTEEDNESNPKESVGQIEIPSDDSTDDEDTDDQSEEEDVSGEVEGEDGSDDDDSSSSEENEQKESRERAERQKRELDDTDYGSSHRSEEGSPLDRTVRSSGEEEIERLQLKNHYKNQLKSIEEGAKGTHTVKADIHTQDNSSSASAPETDSSDSDSEENVEGRALPPVPSQSPPPTLMPSGTYEKPVDPAPEISQLYSRRSSRPRPSLGSETGIQQGSGESAPNSGKLHGLNFFISSSDDEAGKMGQQREPADPGAGTSQDHEYTDIMRSKGGKEATSGAETQVKDKSDQKDSKTCSIM